MVIEIKGEHGTAKVMIDNIEQNVYSQIQDMVNSPIANDSVRIMPDTHLGKGSVIGFTMPLNTKIVPNVVGVDIGCGMLAVNLGIKDLPDKQKFDSDIRAAIPFGFSIHNNGAYHLQNDFPIEEVRRTVDNLASKFTKLQTGKKRLHYAYPEKTTINDIAKRVGCDESRLINSVGTLGGGNHFIEFGKSVETGDIWLVIHSGSRKLGKDIAEYHQKKANYYFGNKNDLNYLEDQDALDYLYDLAFAQRYASESRKEMVRLVCDILGVTPIDEIESVHNFIDFEDMIIRKGACPARKGQRIVIPFNMRDGTLIAVGRGNDDWNQSAPHGAGRIMGRNQAKRTLDVAEFKETMNGVYSSTVNSSTLDEAPMAYKDAKMIEEAIGPTADIVDRLVPIHNLKAGQVEYDEA